MRVDGAAQAQIDEALGVLQAHAQAWAMLEDRARLDILDELRFDIGAVAERWVAGRPLAPNGLRLARWAKQKNGCFWRLFCVRSAWRTRPSPRSCAPDARGCPVHSSSPRPGKPARGWFRVTGGMAGVPGRDRGRLDAGGTTADTLVHSPTAGDVDGARGGVALVLGAGNASMLPVIDVLHQLFVQHRVGLLKPNPVNAYLGPLLEAGLQALIRRSFLRIIYGWRRHGAPTCATIRRSRTCT